MQTPDDSIHDQLGMVLGGGRQRVGNGLREAVFAQTLGVMRRRRRLKRCALAASLLGCYVAGAASMGVWRSGGQETPEMIAAQTTTADAQLQDVLLPSSPVSNAPDATQIAQAIPSGFESWRRIGDHYLRESDDISLAVAGYSRALDLASDQDLAISPGRDNWLLMALKDARVKERKHAHVVPN